MISFRTIGLAILTIVYIATFTAGADEKPKRPNFVFFLVDDLGYMDIGANNPDCFYDTPNIDKLAKSGMRFTDGYAACPVCSPTRLSIMTGQYPSRTDATNYFSGRRAERYAPAPLHDRMDLDLVTIAEALKGFGYSTFFAGKWHLGPTAEFWPEHQGFDVNKGGHNRGGPYGPGKYFVPYGNPRLEDGPKGEHLPDRLARETCKFIEQNKNKPFFAYLSFYSVHTPLVTRQDLREKYAARAKERGLLDKQQFTEIEQNFNTTRKRQVRIVQSHAVYGGMVESMDLAVGKVLDKLDDLGLADNTIVFFTSDNGGLSTSEGSPTSNLPLRGGKGWLYEGGIREPYLVRWPGKTKPGSVCDVPVISTDFFPTIIEMSDQPDSPWRSPDGVSLVNLLRGDANTLEREAIYWHYPHYGNQGGFPGGAIRMGDWKLLERYEDGRVHLYNLKDDIGETKDLAAGQPERVKKMRAKLHAWYKDVDAKFLSAKKNKDGTMGPKPWQPY